MKKIFKILLCLICIGIFIIITFSRYADEKSDISRKIGNKVSGGTISTIEHARISRVHEEYINMLKLGDYETAYNLFSYNYKQFKDYKTFITDVSKLNLEEIAIEEIIKRTENMYSVILNNGDENLIILNDKKNRFVLIPEPFLEYKELNKSLKKKSVKYDILSTTNYVDKFILSMQITNLSKKEAINIIDVKLNDDGTRLINSDFEGLILQPLETKQILIECDTDINIPKKVEISRKFEKKNSIETYSIDI